MAKAMIFTLKISKKQKYIYGLWFPYYRLNRNKIFQHVHFLHGKLINSNLNNLRVALCSSKKIKIVRMWNNLILLTLFSSVVWRFLNGMNTRITDQIFLEKNSINLENFGYKRGNCVSVYEWHELNGGIYFVPFPSWKENYMLRKM